MTDEPPNDEAALAKEVERQRGTVDLMTTMHSLMRDRTRVQGTLLVCVILLASVVATAFAFAGGSSTVTILGLRGERSTWLGWFAVFTFSLTLVDLVLDRRGAAGRHADAVRKLAALMTEYRTLPRSTAVGFEECKRLTDHYRATMEALPLLPERQFNRLKSSHLLKHEISQYLSDHPGLSDREARRAVRRRARATAGLVADQPVERSDVGR